MGEKPNPFMASGGRVALAPEEREAMRRRKPRPEYDHSVIYVSVRELAKRCDCDPATIRKRIREGDLKALRWGPRRTLIHPDDADAFAREYREAHP